MNSSVSLLTVSCDGGASSSSDSGGSGESGMSVNSGRCFSFTTRSDFGSGGAGGTTTIGSRSIVLLAQLLDDVLALGASPPRRCGGRPLPRAARAAIAIAALRCRRRCAPSRCSHEMPKNSEQPDREQREQQQRRAVEAEARAQRPRPSESPNAPPGASGSVAAQLPQRGSPRARRWQKITSAKPMRAEQQRMIGSIVGPRRRGESRRRRARRRRSPTTTPTGRTGRAGGRQATRRRRRRDCAIGAPVPENDQPGSAARVAWRG